MSDIKSFLTVLKKYGYPNTRVFTLASMVGYNLDDFLIDLKNELGYDGVVDFCDKAIEKLSGENGFKVDLETDGQEYVVVNVYPIYYDENESESDVISKLEIKESNILTQDENGKDVYKTVPQIKDEMGMGDWAEYDEMMDHITMKVYDYVRKRCGFGLWWE